MCIIDTFNIIVMGNGISTYLSWGMALQHTCHGEWHFNIPVTRNGTFNIPLWGMALSTYMSRGMALSTYMSW
jgi:hypothetical protein